MQGERYADRRLCHSGLTPLPVCMYLPPRSAPVAASQTSTVPAISSIDSGDGVTHDIPCAKGYAVGSAIKHIPIAGRDIAPWEDEGGIRRK
jgi:hypothetical protein